MPNPMHQGKFPLRDGWPRGIAVGRVRKDQTHERVGRILNGLSIAGGTIVKNDDDNWQIVPGSQMDGSNFYPFQIIWGDSTTAQVRCGYWSRYYGGEDFREETQKDGGGTSADPRPPARAGHARPCGPAARTDSG